MPDEQAREYRDRDEILADIRRAYGELEAYYRKVTSEVYDPFIGYIVSPVFTTRVFLRAIPESAQRNDYNEGLCRCLLQAVNSHFFTSMHAHTEASVALICRAKKVELTSARHRKAERLDLSTWRERQARYCEGGGLLV